MNATEARAELGRVAKATVAAVATVLFAGLSSAPAFGLTIQTGGVSNSGDASAGTGGNSATGNQSTNTATSTNVVGATGDLVGTVGGLVQPTINLGAPQNNSTGSAAVTTGPAEASGNNSGGAVAQGTGPGSGPAVQSATVSNGGSAVATTGGNSATGNQSTNTATVVQNVSGSLVGVALNVGGPSNNSSGTATVTTGMAAALANTSEGSVIQGHGEVGGCGRAASLQRAAVDNTGIGSADTGGNQAVGNASTNTASVVQNVNGGLLDLGLTLLGPTNNSTGSAAIDTGPASAVGNQSTGSVTQAGCVPFRTEQGFFGVDTRVFEAPPPGAALARTGGEPLPLGAAAGVMLVLGLVVLRVASLRRSE